MSNINQWVDPRNTIWGFHVHQELPEADLAKSLVVQEACSNYLQTIGVTIDADDVITAGYGPHLNPMWELRVETHKEKLLEKMGLMLSFLAINRQYMSAYIHPVMQDTSLPVLEQLRHEGETNQVNALWFGEKVEQKQEFFFNPPLDSAGMIQDTRTERVLTNDEKSALLLQGKQELGPVVFRRPDDVIIRGFHIHMDVEDHQVDLSNEVFDAFVMYLLSQGLRPTSTRHYAPKENGPHMKGGWEVKFESRDPANLSTMGVAVAWLMCNRKNLPVFMHPVTWEEGDNEEEIRAHEDYSFFLGEMTELDLDFFRETG